MKTRGLLLIAALVFFYTLITHAPAATLYAWFTPKGAVPVVQLYGLQGTLASGSVSGISIKGRPAVQDLRWNLRPLWLLLGRADFHVEGGGTALTIDGGLSLLLTGGINLHDMEVSGLLKPLLTAIGQPYLPVDGRAQLQVETLKLRKGLPTAAEGVLNLQGLAWTLARDPLLLGDFQAVVSPQAQGTGAVVTTVGGPMDVSGEGQLSLDQSYDLHLQLKAKAGANPMILNLLHSLGQPDVQGYYHLRRSGQPSRPGAPK